MWAIGEQFECEAPLLKKLSTQITFAPIVLNFDPDIVVIDALLRLSSNTMAKSNFHHGEVHL